MKKQTKVLLAAALFTLGASFSSMAALKNGTWVLEEDGWHYANKNGDYESSVWAVSYGKEYWVNEDEVLGASEWVTDDNGNHYYVQSDGSKTVSAWKYIFGEEDDDDEEEESWFYFNSKGKMVTGKQTIGDYTYYFGNDGKMLTGWINTANSEEITAADADTTADTVVYADENGAVVKESWIHAFPWTDDEDNFDEDEINWYYAKSTGRLVVNDKKTIDKLTYIFGDNAEMLTGWVQKIGDNYTDTNAKISKSTSAAYFMDEESGYMKKNGWRKLATPDTINEEDPDDVTEKWYYLGSNGKAFLATATDTNAKKVTFANGEKNEFSVSETNVAVESKEINGVDYYFNERGEMITGLQEITVIGKDGKATTKRMYLKNGAAVVGKTTITDDKDNDYTFAFGDKTENGYVKFDVVNGNMGDYCYKNGQLQTAEEDGEYVLVETANGNFIVDSTGKIQKSSTKEYITEGTTYTFNKKAKGAAKNSIASVDVSTKKDN